MTPCYSRPACATALLVLLVAAQHARPAAAGEELLPLIGSLLPGFVGGKGATAGGKGALRLDAALEAAQHAAVAAAGAAAAAAGPLAAGFGASGSGVGVGGAAGIDLKAAFSAAFRLFCPVLPVQVPPFPIKTAALCKSTGLDQADNGMACALLDTFIGSLVSRPPFTCKAGAIAAPKSTDAQGRPVPRPLADRRVKGKLPTSFPARRLLDEEGGTYAWLYRHVQRVYDLCAPGAKAAAPKGWDLLGTLSLGNILKSYGPNVTGIPLAVAIGQPAVAREKASGACEAAVKGAAGAAGAGLCDGGHIVVAFRGTASGAEWERDFDYSMVYAGAYGPGQAHRGLLALAEQAWGPGGFRALLDAHVAAGDARHITLSGHSSGGALALMLAARAQGYLRLLASNHEAWKSWPGQVPLVSAVTFATPNIGDAEFTAHLDAAVNARNIEFDHDIVPQMPCAPRTTACRGVSVPTPSPKGFWPYARTGGTVLLGPRDLPTTQPEAWAKLAVYSQSDMCTNPATLSWAAHATHYCSYNCALSRYLADGRGDMCLLWPDEVAVANGSATYCMRGYPNTYPHTEPLFPAP